jgi:type IV secretion system protein VirB10
MPIQNDTTLDNDPYEANLRHDGLPPVNRRTGGNKALTIFGYIFALCAVVALFVVANGDKVPKKKNTQQDQVANKLPPLSLPTPPIPQAPVVQAPTPAPVLPQVPMTQQPTAIPIKKDANGKPPMTWTDRKMGGGLLAGQQPGAGSPPPDSNTNQPPSDGHMKTALGGGGENDLAAKLEPTITKATTASVLPDRNFMLTKGTSLDCVLETALDSSLPGLTTCRLTRDVYSDNGQILLLDRGSKLVGEYRGGIKNGQTRVFALWTRAETPNGVIINMDSPGTDALGRSGLDGFVDNHFWERFGAAILMSFVQTSATALANQSQAGSGSGGLSVYSGSGNGGAQVVERILSTTVNIPPTIVKNQGEHIQVMVARDLDFSDVYSLKVTE